MGRFTSPDPFNILTAARDEQEYDSFLANPQNWSRYKYGMNSPLAYIDPNGLKEVTAQDCQAMGSNCATVNLNIIVDPKSNASQKAIDAQINAAKSFYGDANVHFEVSQVSGVANESTVQKDAINVVVSGKGSAPGQAGFSKNGYAIINLNSKTSTPHTMVHELAHHFLGHTTGAMNSVSAWSRSNEIGMVALGLNVYADFRIDGIFGLGGMTTLGAVNYNSKTGVPTPRRDIQGEARMFSPGGGAFKRR